MGIFIDPRPVSGREELAWISGSLEFGRSVGSWLPHGYERYARILHPAQQWGEPGGTTAGPFVTWAQIATSTGKAFRRASAFADLMGYDDGSSWHREGRSLPIEGELVRPHVDRLIALLSIATSTPDQLWLLSWVGGKAWRPTAADAGEVIEISPSLTASGRTYMLYRGSIEAPLIEGSGPGPNQQPSFWWPADCAWFVCTDIDALSTYVGGSSRLIARLLADDLLEVVPAELADPFDGVGTNELGAEGNT